MGLQFRPIHTDIKARVDYKLKQDIEENSG